MEIDLYLEHRLEGWARWCINIKLGNAGWPRESLISKVMLLGLLVHKSGSSPPIRSRPREEQVNFWILQMSRFYPRYSEALALCYLNPQSPRRLIAQELNVSVSALKDRVLKGKIWLQGHITAYIEDELED